MVRKMSNTTGTLEFCEKKGAFESAQEAYDIPVGNQWGYQSTTS